MARTTLIRTSHRGLAVAAVLSAAVTLSACGSSSGSSSTAASGSSGGSSSASSGASKHLKIGFSPFTLQVPALKGLADGLTAVAKGQGDTVITADPKGDPSTQLQQLQQWVQLGQVDAIWVIPASPQAVAPAVKAAQAKGIVVIASGVPSDYGLTKGAPGITFTNVDNVAFGKQLGDSAAKCITERLGGKGQVIFLQSPSGQQSTGAINTNIKAALTAGAAGSKIVNQQAAKDRLGSQQSVSSALQGAPSANTLIATDDESTLGGLAAFQQAGKDPSKICVIGAGGNEEAVAAVKSGKVYSELSFDFQADLMQNLKELHTLGANPKAPGNSLTTPIKSVTK